MNEISKDLSLGEKLKLVCEQRGMTSTDLANAANMKKQTIYKYERNSIRNVPYESIKRLADALDVNPAWLVGWSSEIERPYDIEKDPIPTEMI